MTFGNLSFLMPWAFVGVAILPLLWLFMKTTPPKPQKVKFPAVRILQELTTDKIVATKTPWWILLLRCLIVVMLIIALAQPVINQAKTIGDQENPVVVIVDNDWSVMDRWADREQELSLIIDQAARADRPILLVATADLLDENPLVFSDAETMRAQNTSLLVKSWQTNRSSWLIKLETLLSVQDEKPDIFWITNGVNEKENERFASRLSKLGQLNIISDSDSRIPVIVRDVKRTKEGLFVQLGSIAQDVQRNVEIQMLDEKGDVIYVHNAELEANQNNHELSLRFPEELRAQTERIKISGQINSGSQYLMDERWRDKAVGVTALSKPSQSLTEASFYIEKALNPYVNIRFEELNELIKRDLSLLVDLGQETLSQTQREQVIQWVEKGGIFVRFANENHTRLTPLDDPLLPVQLIKGTRTFGGALSWKEDPRLAAFDVSSPFQGINLADEIFIHQQVLARPSSQIENNTWARLRDGTPLITSKKIGNGFSVLFHISADPATSDLPYSGVFEEMMIRLVSLSTGFSSADPDQALNPYLIFDGNGQLSPAHDEVQPLTVKALNAQETSIYHPPGLYGQANALKAFNLGSQINEFKAHNNLPTEVTLRGFEQTDETNLVPWVLLMVMMLVLLDWVLTLKLKQFYKPATVALLALMIAPNPTTATEPSFEEWQQLVEASTNMRLAYVVTGEQKMDQVSRRGLNGLSMVLRRRTAVEFSEPMAFDPETDDPVLFPMIYWPVNENQADLSDKAAERLSRFMRTGGFILFDTLGKTQPEAMSRLSEQLKIGTLAPVQEPHVMTRSFYLMERFPGRYNNPDVWVEANQDASRDRVSSIMVGSNSWAHAWARDDQLRPLYPVVPGGEIQREQAYRFGINLVMYVLSGNYKADQVHMPTIIQRLGL